MVNANGGEDWQDMARKASPRGVNLLRPRLNDYADAVPRLTQGPAVLFTNNRGEWIMRIQGRAQGLGVLAHA